MSGLYLAFLSNFDVIHVLKNCSDSYAMSQNITWSVSIEEQFYLIWPLLVVATPRRFLGFVILVVFSIAEGFQLAHLDDDRILYFHSIPRFADLAMGGLFAYYSFSNLSFRTFFSKFSQTHQLILFITIFLWASHQG